jgi:hypothetical protein
MTLTTDANYDTTLVPTNAGVVTPDAGTPVNDEIM